MLKVEGPQKKRLLAIGVLAVLLISGSLIVLRYSWLPSDDDNGTTVTNLLEFWIASRSYNFSMDCEFYPSESSAEDEIAEMKYFGVDYPIAADAAADNHHTILIFDLPEELVSLWCRVQIASDQHILTNPTITEIVMDTLKMVTVGTYEISFLMTPSLE